MKHDLSTLDVAALSKLPLLGELPSGYHLQRDPGNGCYGDPPGYPTYFTRSVYTPNGNNPGRGPTTVIDSPDGPRVVATAETEWLKGDTWDTAHARRAALLRGLYAPLPFDHARVQAWVSAVHHHMQHCYKDDAGAAEPFEHGKPAMIIFPVPNYKLRTFHDDPRFSEEWRAKERAAVDQENADKRAAYTAVATPANHCARCAPSASSTPTTTPPRRASPRSKRPRGRATGGSAARPARRPPSARPAAT